MKPSQVLGADGVLARDLPDFQPRLAQQGMADAVAAAFDARVHLLVEAGTGTGKTYAYLVPALLSGQRILVSTATRTLQDQLFERDLPRLLAALGSAASCALLKGRGNYLCLHRLAAAEGHPDLFPEDVARVARVAAWARATVTGDIAELSDLPEDAPFWPQVTSTVDNCLGGACPRFDDCFVVRARRAAAAADLVVVNHHLLFADMTLREEGFGELLPSAHAIVADEAHALPELAAQAFGHTVSSRQLRDLARDTARAADSEAPDMPDLAHAVRGLEQAAQGALGEFARFQGRRDLPLAGTDPGYDGTMQRISASSRQLAEVLVTAAERGPALAACARRAQLLLERLAGFAQDDADDRVLWLEAGARGFVLHATPLGVATQFRERVERTGATWIFCSATLAVGGDFSHFQRELGLDDAPAISWDSPFDFARQTLRFLPRLPVMPNEAGYLEAVATLAREVILLCGGRTFLLCTSHRALGHYAGPLRASLPYPVLVQGEQPRAALLDRFVQLGNAVLIGTATFWEGVDVRGEALSCVIIDKLPFAPPDDPVLRARNRRLADLGRDGFRDYQLPVAALMLKQGAGRLIRDPSDRGVLVLCDPRLRTRGYGRTFLRALPAMPETAELADVAAFFERGDGDPPADPPDPGGNA